jgi:hypothetical protein
MTMNLSTEHLSNWIEESTRIADPTGTQVPPRVDGEEVLTGDEVENLHSIPDPVHNVNVLLRSDFPRKVLRVPGISKKPLSFSQEERYILLKKFEGVVTHIHPDCFIARIKENFSDYPLIEAEISFDELSETDRSLALEGAQFVWTIGYSYSGSTRKRESMIYFRRLTAWTETELAYSQSNVQQLLGEIRWQ